MAVLESAMMDFMVYLSIVGYAWTLSIDSVRAHVYRTPTTSPPWRSLRAYEQGPVYSTATCVIRMNLLQRLVIANLFGFGFVGISWVVVVLIHEASNGRGPWALPWLLGSLLLILLDVGYRYRGMRSKTGRERDGVSSRFNNRWLGPLRGATLILLPAWRLCRNS
jgi:hypothetical protein